MVYFALIDEIQGDNATSEIESYSTCGDIERREPLVFLIPMRNTNWLLLHINCILA